MNIFAHPKGTNARRRISFVQLISSFVSKDLFFTSLAWSWLLMFSLDYNPNRSYRFFIPFFNNHMKRNCTQFCNPFIRIS
jgi:hypothetical protein